MVVQAIVMPVRQIFHKDAKEQDLESFWIAEHVEFLESSLSREGLETPTPSAVPCPAQLFPCALGNTLYC